MPDKRDGLEGLRLDEAAARRLLERATELDARLASESTIADLREAARGAGISDEAFQRALAEVRREQVPAAETRVGAKRGHPRRRIMTALAIALAVGLGLAVFRMVAPNPIERPSTPEAVAPATTPPSPAPSRSVAPALPTPARVAPATPAPVAPPRGR